MLGACYPPPIKHRGATQQQETVKGKRFSRK
jgi:hypothetical protein